MPYTTRKMPIIQATIVGRLKKGKMSKPARIQIMPITSLFEKIPTVLLLQLIAMMLTLVSL
jgi:hypothetical protein